MNNLLFFTILCLLIGFYFSTPFILKLTGLAIFFMIGLLAVFVVLYFKELMSNDQRPPVVGSVFSMLIHFNHLYDYTTLIAKKHHTFRFVTPTHSEVYTADPINVEHILKNNFSNYTKGPFHKGILGDLLGNGIFAADGDIWRHQRKLASYEFSTKVLRDFSTDVFRSNTAKLVIKLTDAAVHMQIINLQDLLMKSTLDSIFKVGFGFDLDTLSGSNEVSNRFMTAFDDSNGITYWRYVDLLWRVKRYINVGSEAILKKNINVIDSFVFELIEHKREQMKNGKLNNKMDVDQLKGAESVSYDSVKKLDKSDKDATMGFKNNNLSSSPLVDKGVVSLCPITPFSNKEGVDSTSKVISPSTASSSMSIDGDIPSTPMEDVFDSLAAGRDKHMKHGEKSESYVARKLNFNSGDKERASDSGFRDGTVMESVYASILDGIVSKEAEDILSEIVAVDVLMIPPSAPRLSGIAKTCPGAPMKPTTKSRNIDARLCRKLEF